MVIVINVSRAQDKGLMHLQITRQLGDFKCRLR